VDEGGKKNSESKIIFLEEKKGARQTICDKHF
jgi:hypothetical protein